MCQEVMETVDNSGGCSDMKYVVILGDGMADCPLESLGDKTPLEYANTPQMDALAAQGEIGMVHTIPDGMKPGSDTANLSVLGYDPREFYSGRSPLEALSIGVPMKETDIALRCNIVTLSEGEKRYEERTIVRSQFGRDKYGGVRDFARRSKKRAGEQPISILCGNQLPPLPDLGAG